ncbi:MAG: MFS transporter [Kiloniellales bacterium]
MASSDDTRTTASRKRATLLTCGAGHFLHDGFHDLVVVLLPVWQLAFGLSLSQVGLLMTCYTGAMASFQVPAGMLAERLGERVLLALGTLVTAVGFMTLGLMGGFVTLAGVLLVAGLGSGAQHPLAATLVARAYRDGGQRAAMGTYNFTGDLGKMAVPGLAALVIAGAGWHWATTGYGGIGVVMALVIYLALRRLDTGGKQAPRQGGPDRDLPAGWGIVNKPAFGALSAIAIIDTGTRLGFLTFLPFLLIGKGLPVEWVGLALMLIFAGGAAGKLLCGLIAERFGVIRTVVLTEAVTGGGILMLLVLPLAPILVFLPFLGAALNGTSSVLYGSVADFVSADRQARAFGLFYTLGVAAGAVAPSILGVMSDLTGVATTIGIVGAVALTTIPLARVIQVTAARTVPVA